MWSHHDTKSAIDSFFFMTNWIEMETGKSIVLNTEIVRPTWVLFKRFPLKDVKDDFVTYCRKILWTKVPKHGRHHLAYWRMHTQDYGGLGCRQKVTIVATVIYCYGIVNIILFHQPHIDSLKIHKIYSKRWDFEETQQFDVLFPRAAYAKQV